MSEYGTPIWLRVLPAVLWRMKMEKYGVKTKKPEQIKKEQGEKTAGVDDPNVNVPKHPDKGTEPYEERPNGQEEG